MKLKFPKLTISQVWEILTGLTALILVGLIARSFKGNIEHFNDNIPILITTAFPLIAGIAVFLAIVLSQPLSLVRILGLITLVFIPVMGV